MKKLIGTHIKDTYMKSTHFLAFITACLLTLSAHAGDMNKPAPDFTAKTLSGENVRLKDFRGKVVMVNFWASWCGPCRQEMPLIEKIYKDYKKSGFVLLGLNVDGEADERDEFLKDTPVSFPILDDSEGKVADLFGNEAMPSTYFVDRKGNIRHLHKGYKKGEERDYIKQIKKLIAE